MGVEKSLGVTCSLASPRRLLRSRSSSILDTDRSFQPHHQLWLTISRYRYLRRFRSVVRLIIPSIEVASLGDFGATLATRTQGRCLSNHNINSRHQKYFNLQNLVWLLYATVWLAVFLFRGICTPQYRRQRKGVSVPTFL